MERELEDYLGWLRRSGVDFTVAPGIVRDPDKDGSRVSGDATTRHLAMPGLPGIVEHRDPTTGVASDHATHSVAWAMLRSKPARRVWDVGCGTGVLAVVAKLAGAREVLATDVDPRALELAARTAYAAGVEIGLLEGSLLEPLPDGAQADLVVANLPHKPVPEGMDLLVAQNGGPSGCEVHCAFAIQAEARLRAGARVLFFAHSLPDPQLLRCHAESFALELVSWKRRYLLPGEFGRLQDHFLERARRG